MQLVKYVEVRRMEETMLPIEEGIAHHKGDHHFKQGHWERIPCVGESPFQRDLHSESVISDGPGCYERNDEDVLHAVP